MDSVELGSTVGILRQSVLLNFKTGVWWIDILLPVIGITFFTWLFTVLKTWWSNNQDLFSILRRRRNEYLVSGTRTSFSDGGINTHFSYSLKAIVHRLMKLGTDISSLEESHNISRKGTMLIRQTKYLKIDESIYCQITSEKRTIDRNDVASNEIFRCVLFSYVYTSLEINEKLDVWRQEYAIDQEIANNNKQYFLIQGAIKANSSFVSFTETPFSSTRSFDNLFFEGKEIILEHLNHFINNEGWYRRTGTPYTLGFCFYGLPGTGKTSAIKAIANYTKRSLVEVSLSQIQTYEQLLYIFHNKLSECEVSVNRRIILFEDIDAIADIIKKRDVNVNVDADADANADVDDDDDDSKKKTRTKEPIKTSELKLGHILNCLDGVLESHGRIVIMTTNHPEKIDPALLRPGRIDVKMEFKRCTLPVLEQILQHYYELDFPIELPHSLDGAVTPAEVSCVCKMYRTDWRAAIQALVLQV